MALGQCQTEVGPVRELGGKLFIDGHGLGVGRLRFLKSSGVLEQPAEIVVTHGQCPAEVGPIGELDGELLANCQGLGVGCLRFLQPPGDVKQVAQVVVDAGQGLAELGPVGKLGGELFKNGQGRGVGRLRFRQPTGGLDHHTQLVVAQGQFLPELGPGGEVDGEFLAARHCTAISVFTVLETAQNLVHVPHPKVSSRLSRPFLFGGGPSLRRLGVVLDHFVQEVFLLRSQLLLARELLDGSF